MALFRIARRTRLAPAETWRRLTDWERHGDSVPLTRVTVHTPPPSGTGTVLVARTGLGPLGFDDRMEITRWQPPTGAARACAAWKSAAGRSPAGPRSRWAGQGRGRTWSGERTCAYAGSRARWTG